MVARVAIMRSWWSIPAEPLESSATLASGIDTECRQSAKTGDEDGVARMKIETGGQPKAVPKDGGRKMSRAS